LLLEVMDRLLVHLVDVCGIGEGRRFILGVASGRAHVLAVEALVHEPAGDTHEQHPVECEADLQRGHTSFLIAETVLVTFCSAVWTSAAAFGPNFQPTKPPARKERIAVMA
jgi:hypothetical protein